MTRLSLTAALATLLAAPAAGAKVLITADGPGGTPTYEILGRVCTIEVPDCGHMVPHITEVMDDELKKNVFVFHAHVNQDDDRCGATDRQRTEIRAGKSGDVVASNGQTVYYRWKFRLPEGFQTSASFTHIFQIKSDAAAPVMTLTPRGTNLSIDGIVGVRGTTPLAKFIGTWVVVDLKLVFATAGHIDMTIRKLAGGEMLFSHSGAADTWQGNAAGHDPKWGIYRSLNNKASLRDEQVRFADFCVSKQSAADCDDGTAPPLPETDAGAGPPPADAGTTAPRPDAGTATADLGTSTPAEPDAGSTKPTTPAPDAAAGAPRPDTKPASGPGPSEPTEDPPTDSPPTKSAKGGCQYGSTGSPAAGLALAALALLLRRRRR
jgi:MYXO-CTERM domain-containing protein